MQNILSEEVKERLSKGEEINLVDVREPYEHAEFNIGGTLCPLGKIQSMMVDELEDLKDKEVVLYCRSGNRSGQACMILDMLGFTNTKNLVGGMNAWQEKFENKSTTK
jgi:rhodanese-related sulfurtransferase